MTETKEPRAGAALQQAHIRLLSITRGMSRNLDQAEDAAVAWASQSPTTVKLQRMDQGAGTSRESVFDIATLIALARMAVVPFGTSRDQLRFDGGEGFDELYESPADLEADMLMGILRLGKASPDDQWRAANWIRMRYGIEPLEAPASLSTEPRKKSADSTRTSVARIRRGEFSAMVRRVLACFKNAPDGLTDFELEIQCGSHSSCWRSRRNELFLAGKVRPDGKRTLEGGERTIWRLA